MSPESLSMSITQPTVIKTYNAEIQMLSFNGRDDDKLPIDVIDNSGFVVCMDISVDDAEDMIKHLQTYIAYAKTETIGVPARHVEKVKDFLRELDKD